MISSKFSNTKFAVPVFPQPVAVVLDNARKRVRLLYRAVGVDCYWVMLVEVFTAGLASGNIL
ncbi:hypothetical protein BJX63DRAFT_408748 [Aspergillus granulosus]|uniref:Uncharacterized protein n=1 Tax=Aspergillus granulosus TaxID=176169 RepID=A0ABR4GZN4_9EURO